MACAPGGGRGEPRAPTLRAAVERLLPARLGGGRDHRHGALARHAGAHALRLRTDGRAEQRGAGVSGPDAAAAVVRDVRGGAGGPIQQAADLVRFAAGVVGDVFRPDGAGGADRHRLLAAAGVRVRGRHDLVGRVSDAAGDDRRCRGSEPGRASGGAGLEHRQRGADPRPADRRGASCRRSGPSGRICSRPACFSWRRRSHRR